MARKYAGKWEGGFIREDDGVRTFYIRKMIDGTRYTLSTGAHTIQGALVALARFEAAPARFKPLDMGAAPLYLDGRLVREFLGWAATKQNRNGTIGNSDEWLRRQGYTLKWWGGELKGQDLRRQDPKSIKAISEDRNRLTVLLALYSWLRKVKNEISPNEDPFLDKIRIPPSKRADNIKSKIFKLEDWKRTHEWLKAHPIDTVRGPKKRVWSRLITATMMEVLLSSGWHVRETLRMALEGEIEKVKGGGKFTTPKAKKGTAHSCYVSKKGYEAAIRLREMVTAQASKDMQLRVMENHIHEDMRDAKKATGVEIKMGSHRHTAVVHAREAGNTDDQIAAQVGNSAKMIRLTYGSRATPPKMETLI